eukprot:TRINITY_DN678_c0_g1_i1.p1 TRINITY_DN678_c0_g1~~TRINITY_DN678_c0_g1_i1.p1  ORF type:complete len:733 (+),score=123.68 TRINITY_DN678_c0_g1_i1:113-2311(+)
MNAGIAILLLLILNVVGTRAYTGVSSKPFATTNPNFIHVKNQLIQKEPSYWGNVQYPYPTNSWYTNLGFKSYPIFTYPYIVLPVESGITFCYPVLQPNPAHFTSTWNEDMLFWIDSMSDRKIVSYEVLGATTTWNNSIGESLSVLWVPGHPYITVKFTGYLFNISTNHAIKLINGEVPEPGKCYNHTKYKLNMYNVPTNRYQTWLIYSITGVISLCYQTDARISPDGAKHPVLFGTTKSVASSETVIRFAIIPNDDGSNNNVETVLDTYVPNVVTAGFVDVDYPIVDNVSTYSFAWQVEDSHGLPYYGNDVLMLGLPHHQDIIDTSNLNAVVLPYIYRVSKGPLVGYVGRLWYLKENLTTIEWYARHPIDDAKKLALRYELAKDIKNAEPGDWDIYGYGKYVAALARLSLIAEELGDLDSAKLARDKLKLKITPWLNRVTYRDTFLYDTTWGGTISAMGWLDGGRDYGSGKYNDHHFHNGYYIYAAAVIVKAEPNWPLIPQIIDLIRDVANPSSDDPYFPITRHFDWFTGHSWAMGLDFVPDGKNQESTSEAVNCYYAIMLFGMALGNDHMRDLGRLMATAEIRGARKYWHMDKVSSIYPEEFSANAIVGVMWSDKADYATFFGDLIEYIHCIQMLPFTPITEDLLKRPWLDYEYSVLSPILTKRTVAEEWKAYIYEDWAIINKDAAWTKSLTLTNAAFEHGNTRSNLYWWIATRPLTNTTTTDTNTTTFET